METAAARRRLDALSLASFVALGLPDGMLGTAWPSMRHSLHAPVGDLGLVLLASTAGSVAVATLVGAAIRRTGVPVLLAGGLACAAAAAGGFVIAPSLGVILGVAVLFGIAAGMMDGGLNTAIGLSGRRRLLNLLHAAYGVGTAVGPLLVTAAIVAGSWRPAYGCLLAADVLVAALWVLQRRAAVTRATAHDAVPGRPDPADPDLEHREAPGPGPDWTAKRSAGPIEPGAASPRLAYHQGRERWEAEARRFEARRPRARRPRAGRGPPPKEQALVSRGTSVQRP